MSDELIFGDGSVPYVIISCKGCGKRKAKGSTAARYCSDACRQAAYRDRKAQRAMNSIWGAYKASLPKTTPQDRA